uniref:Uncharacterized protein n=1 Tax=Romanomermis culicivorax TaxID=13658 RepID=A0A915KBG8_ROMCU
MVKEKGKNVGGYDTLSEDEEFEEAWSEKQIQAQITKKAVDMVNQGYQTAGATPMDAKFVGLTTLLTNSTNSKTKSMPTNQRPRTTSSTSQAQSMMVTTKVPSKTTTSQHFAYWSYYLIGNTNRTNM